MAGDIEYFRQRAAEERTAALQARDLRARDLHIELAERYEDLVCAIVGHDQFLGLDLVMRPDPPSDSATA